MSQVEFVQWPADADIGLHALLLDINGLPATGKTPEVSIRRYRETKGSLLDNNFWDGVSAFTAIPTWLTLPPVDAVNSPGLYLFEFEQSLVGLETIYHVFYRHTVAPLGYAFETHIVTNEVYVPNTQPDPIVIGPSSIMGQLELIKDGGLGDFDPDIHALSKLGFGLERVLGLLHHNAIVDNQIYGTNQQITSARIRVFDSAANVPISPGGSETTGLIQEYAVTMEYTGVGVLSNYQLKQVL